MLSLQLKMLIYLEGLRVGLRLGVNPPVNLYSNYIYIYTLI